MNALGIIETLGLAAAVEAADVAVKSANVELIGYELAKGSGFTAVKITGDVGAVNAAMQAAQAAVPHITRVVAHVTIPRPSTGIERMVYSKDTVGHKKPAAKKDAPKAAVKPEAPAKTTGTVKAEPKKAAPAKAEAPKTEAKKTEPAKKGDAPKAEPKKAEPAKKPEPKKPEPKKAASPKKPEPKKPVARKKPDPR